MAFESGASGNLLQLALSSYDECIDGHRGVPAILTVLEGRLQYSAVLVIREGYVSLDRWYSRASNMYDCYG